MHICGKRHDLRRSRPIVAVLPDLEDTRLLRPRPRKKKREGGEGGSLALDIAIRQTDSKLHPQSTAVGRLPRIAYSPFSFYTA